MTTTANSSTNTVGTNPTTIASSFARKYYSILSKEPHNLFHFYKENSVFIRGIEDTESEESTFGKENINKKIQSLQYQDCKVSVSALEAQPSVDNGILLTAVGLLSNKGEPPKRFVQTFFLAPQTDPVGYYVRNDIFFYLKDQPNVGRQVSDEKPRETEKQQATAQPAVVQQAPEPKQAHVEVPKQATPASPTPVPATATPTVVVPPSVAQFSPAAVHSPTTSQVAQSPVQQVQKESQKDAQKVSQKEAPKEEAKKPEKPTHEKKQHQEKKQDGEHAAQQGQQTHEKKPKPEGKQKQPKGQQAPQQPQQPAQPAKPAVATWASVAASQNQQPAPPPDVILKQQQEMLTQKSEEEKQKDPENLPVATSVYVTNLPYSATEQQVRTQFSTLGEVKNIVMRKGFCFIEFSTREVMKAVIDKAAKEPVVMDGRTLNVEQKKKGGNKGKSDKKENKGPKENKEGKESKEGKPRKQPQQNNHESPRSDTKREKPQQATNVNSKQPSEKTANHQPKPKAAAPPKQ